MKNIEKRVLALLLAAVMAAAMLTGCNNKQEAAKPEETVSETETNTEAETKTETETDMGDSAAAENPWYELDAEAGLLTVRLPDEDPDFLWSFEVEHETVLELLTNETTDGVYVASFRALEDGITQITFNHAKGNTLDEIRPLKLQCKDGKVTEVLDSGIVDMSGEAE